MIETQYQPTLGRR